MLDFVTIDFETANRKRNSVCSVGVVKVTNGKITDEYYSLINPMQHFDSINIGVHGIRKQDVLEAPTFSDYWASLYAQLKGNIVIAHNASFDMGVLRASLDQMNHVYPELTYSCSYLVAKKAYPELQSYRLSSIASNLGIPLNHHHALDDARASAKIILDASSRYRASTMEELHQQSGISFGHIYPGGYKAASGAKKKSAYFQK